MRRTFARVRGLAAAAATAVLVHTTAAQALGLGEINVDSLLNQRFSAVIPLYEIDAEDLETLSLSLAPAEAFDRAGLERSDYLSSLEFVIKNDQGRPRVVITSPQIAHEPVMNLLVQARWSGGKLMREYTVLLDPPQLALPVTSKPVKEAKPVVPPPLPAPAVVVTPAAAPPPRLAAPKPAPPAKAETEFYETSTELAPRPAAKPAPAPVRKPEAASASAAPATSGPSYGPVQAQETLWSIASRLRPDASVSMDQVMYALALANPKTIQRGTTVNKGALLNVPLLPAMAAYTPAEAKAGLAALRKPGGGLPKAEKPEKAAAAPVSKPSPPPKPPQAAASKPEVKAEPAASKPTAPVVAAPAIKPSEPPPTAASAAPTKPLVKSVAEAFPSAVKPEAVKTLPSPPPPAPAAAPAPAAKIEAAPEVKPAAPSLTTAAAATAAAAIKPETAAPAAPSTETPATTPAAEPVVEPPPPPPASTPSLAQPLPAEEEEGGILELLSAWALPLGGLLALVLIGMVGSRALTARRGGKKAAPSAPESPRAVTAAAVAGSKLGDTQVDATRSMPAPSMEQTQAITQNFDSGSEGIKPSAFESTLVIQPEMAATLHNAVPQTQVGQKKTDFDMTTQLQAETLHINLDANDPISEADFHLAYGLYDEAILLLKQALGKTPERDDVRVKLAETYFAAGKPMEFQLLAEELKPRLSPAEWGKIAIMGSQLCPGVALFKSDAGAELAADFDLGFDEPDLSLPPEPIQSIPAAISPLPSPLPPPVAIESPSLDLAPLELPEVAIPPLAEVPPVAPSPVEFKLELDPALVGDVKDIPEEDPDSIDFMLGQSITPLGAASASPPPALDSNLLEFDLDSSMNSSPAHAKVKAPGVVDELPGLDLQLSLSGDAPQSSLAPAARATPEPELDLADFEISLTPREMDAGSVEDEFNTKLDLARAYVEMGDNEMARGLLQEVQQQGSAVQKSEASNLLERLPA
jgi:pilus assembly protein FimV